MTTQAVSGFKLSQQQQRVWETRGEAEPSLSQVAVRVPGGTLSWQRAQPRLRTAVTELVARHEILRTAYARRPGMALPLQVIGETTEVRWLDAAGASSEASRKGRADALLALHRREPLDLAHAAPLRVSATGAGPDEEDDWLLALSLPALSADADTLRSLVLELLAELRGQTPEEEPIQYADFAQWQEELLAEEDPEAEAGERFWQPRPAAPNPELPSPELPVPARPEPAQLEATADTGLVRRTLPAAAGEAVERAAAALDLAPDSFVFAAWALLLHRRSGARELLLGRVFAGRDLEELEDVVGLLARRLPVVSDLAGNPPWRDFAARLATRSAAVQRFQDFVPPALTSPAWSFQAADWRGTGVEVRTLAAQPGDPSADTSGSALTWLWTDDGPRVELRFSPATLPQPTAEQLLAHLEELLPVLAEHPERRPGDLEILSPEELARLEALDVPAPSRASTVLLSRRWEAQAETDPEAPALVCRSLDGEEVTLSRGQLERRANRLARRLRQLGIGAEVPVALLLPRSELAPVALLAVLKAGGAYLPLEPGLPPLRLASLMTDAGAGALITTAELAAELGQALGDLSVPTVVLEAAARFDGWEGFESARLSVEPAPESLAYVLFTSGSTGRPKAVMVEHRHLNAYLDAAVQRLELEPGAYAMVSTLAADLGNTMLLPALALGGVLHLLPEEVVGDPVALGETFQRRPVDYLKIVPSHLGALLTVAREAREAREAGETALPLPRRRLVLGGEAASRELLEAVARAAPELAVCNHYGPTESTVGIVTGELTAEDRAAGVLPLGTPLAGTAVHLLDRFLQRVPPGALGELWAGGAQVSRGYLGRPGQTAERFLPDPFSNTPGARLYRTGDRARLLPDGRLLFAGRADHQVKVRGYRIELGEVEAVLGEHPALWESVVVVRRDDGEASLVAYGVPRPGQQPTADELRSYLEERLPAYMVPARWVLLEQLPRTANGKVDRQNLPEPAAVTDHRAPYVEPSSEAERILARVWAEVLGIEEISAEDNFFRLGGDSILSIQVIAKSNREGLRLQPQQIFEHQTVAALARVAELVEEPAAEREAATGEVPLTPIQSWFFGQDFADPHHWNQAFLMQLPALSDDDGDDGALTWGALEPAVAALVEHHEALRLRFLAETDGEGSGWKQAIAPPPALDGVVQRVDLGETADDELSAAIEDHARRAQGSLDLGAGPILRLLYFDTGPWRPPRLLWIVHHLAVDAVSWRILLEDLFTLWQAAAAGRSGELPPRTTSFQHWAELLQDRARDSTDEELELWRSLLPAAVESLPKDRPDGANTVAEEAVLAVELDPERSASLGPAAAAAYRATVEEVLITALGRGYRRWSGAGGLLVELEGHGREALLDGVDLSRTVGWFTTHFPFFVPGTLSNQDLSNQDGDEPGAALLAGKEDLRRLPLRGLGFGLLHHLGPEAIRHELAALPEPELKLNYLGQVDRGAGGSEGAAEDGTTPEMTTAAEDAGPRRSPRCRRARWLDVTATLAGGRLRFEWRYSRQVFDAETVEALARAVLSETEVLADHCRRPDSGALSPSDFPLAAVSRQRLERLQGELEATVESGAAAARRVEDLYPTSPLQQSLLAHQAAAAGSTVGFEQKVFTLGGGLDGDAFRRAWQEVMDRHGILRTAFFWDGAGTPLQLVLRQVTAEVSALDWRPLDAATAAERLEELLAEDRRRGFDPAAPPLTRATVITLSEDRRQVVWSYSHLLLDAWSRTLVLREVLSRYARLTGGAAELVPARPYRDYIAWLAEQDEAPAREFWRRSLEGFHAPTPLWLDRLMPGERQPGYGQHPVTVSEATAEALGRLTRDRGLTLGTLVQGAWALLLARYSGHRRVVFGITVAGRPAELDGSDEMLGMFINNLPVAVEVEGGSSLGSWLEAFQRQLAEVRRYEWCAPEQIYRWAELPWGQRIFDTLVLFQNYPVDEVQGQGEHEGDAESGASGILDYRGRLETAVPVTVVASAQPALRVDLHYDRRRLPTAAVEQLARHLGTVLAGVAEGLAGGGETPVASLPLLSVAEGEGLEAPADLRRQLDVQDDEHGLWLVDDALRPVPPGTPGELALGHREGEEPGESLRRTGVFGVRTGPPSEGSETAEVEILGTAERRLILGGETVWPGVAEALLRRHPKVADARVQAAPDDAPEPSLVAYVEVPEVSDEAFPELLEELQARLEERLPRRWVPASLVALEALPREAGGTVDGIVDGTVDAGRLPTPEAVLGEVPGAVHRARTPARDPLELMLVGVWEEVFGFGPIGVRDDFFELGGHSLLALRMVRRIPAHFARDLPPSVLLEAPTVEALAQRLRSGMKTGSLDGEEWTPLVELQAGDGGVPIFCVHPLGGEVLCYRALASALGEDQRVFALQSRSWEPDLEPHETVEEMAQVYLEEARRVQPEGPYSLLGWSFGGLVALEMAQRWRAAGDEVALLGILDTGLAVPESERPGDAELVYHFAGRPDALTVEELEELGELDRMLEHAVELGRRRGFLPPGVDLATARAYFRAGAANRRAKGRYRPRPYAGEITLFRAEEGHRVHATREDLGWGELAEGGLEIVDVPGDHDRLVERPQVRVLAEKIRRRLDRIKGGA